MSDAVVPIVVVDELVTGPGRGAEVLAAYEAEYMTHARARGMRLLHAWVSPPTMLTAGSNTLLFAWQVEGVEGWWRQRAGGRDPDVLAFWERLEPLLESRSRRHCAEPADLAALADVL